jgi:hypothetical protein
MNSENDNPDKQEQQDNPNAAETADREQMSRLADELALRAEESELRYDKDHDIFTK